MIKIWYCNELFYRKKCLKYQKNSIKAANMLTFLEFYIKIGNLHVRIVCYIDGKFEFLNRKFKKVRFIIKGTINKKYYLSVLHH